MFDRPAPHKLVTSAGLQTQSAFVDGNVGLRLISRQDHHINILRVDLVSCRLRVDLPGYDTNVSTGA